jgi:hypothetical protein
MEMKKGLDPTLTGNEKFISTTPSPPFKLDTKPSMGIGSVWLRTVFPGVSSSWAFKISTVKVIVGSGVPLVSRPI